MTGGALLFVLLVSTSFNSAAGLRSRFRGAPVLAANHSVRIPSRAQTEQDIPVLVVRVPVLHVMVVDEDPSNASEAVPPEAHDSDSLCKFEMMKMAMNRSHVANSHICEQRTNSSQRALASLQAGNASKAEAVVQETFEHCGGFSVTCSKSFAPDVILKMRLSGLAVSEECGKVGQTTRGTRNGTCENAATRAMVQELQKEDLNGAISEAQRGLHACQHMRRPCDFQLAPILVGQLMQAGAEQEMAEVFLTGLQAAEEMSAELEGSMASAAGAQPKRANSSAPRTSRMNASKTITKKKKALSLLSIAQRVRLSSERRTVSL